MKIKTIDFYDSFYIVSEPVSKKNYRGNIEDDNGNFGKLLRGEYLPSHLEITHLEGGKEPGDLLWCHVNDPFCVSEKVRKILFDNEISGIEFIPTTITNKNKRQSSTQYYTVIIIGRVDNIDYINSEVRFITKDGTVKESAYFIGKKFDIDSWDSTDFFMEREDSEGNSTGYIYASQKVVDLFKKNKITNILFEKLSEYETWCNLIKIGTNEDMKRKIDEKIMNASAQQCI